MMRFRLYALVPAITGLLALTSCAFAPDEVLRDVALDTLQQELHNFGVSVDVTREQASCLLGELERSGISIDQVPQIVADAAGGHPETIEKIEQVITNSTATCGVDVDNAAGN
ncbi:hypothetical protein [Gulosibacter bifidus]|uniref:Lipoprotein n=1 Tax=Gulosibacter bifidus TaxID=272239 RepID=A0ABW5RJM1_9MICO|nr:hypothetical protein [Gulosibacter bifidus]